MANGELLPSSLKMDSKEFSVKFLKYSLDAQECDHQDYVMKIANRHMIYTNDECKQRREELRKKLWQNTMEMHGQLGMYEEGLSSKEEFILGFELKIKEREEINNQYPNINEDGCYYR